MAEGVNFQAALTDNGVCKVYNGASLGNAFAISDGNKVQELSNAFDRRRDKGEAYVDKINGTGQTYEKVLWLNLADRYHCIYVWLHR